MRTEVMREQYRTWILAALLVTSAAAGAGTASGADAAAAAPTGARP